MSNTVKTIDSATKPDKKVRLVQETNIMKTIDDLTEKIFWYGAGIVGAEDIAPEDKDKAIMNTLAHAKKEAKQTLSAMVEEIIHPAMLNDSIYQRQLELAADRGFTIGVSND